MKKKGDMNLYIGTAIMRHADAGYEKAIENAKKLGVKIPMMK